MLVWWRRSINGTLDLHDELEETLAKFKGTEATIAYQSGFNCNMRYFYNEQKRCDSFR